MNRQNLSLFQQWGLVLLLAFLYALSGKLSILLLSGEKIVTLGVFAAEGVALAFVLFFGKKVLPGIFLGQFILAYSNAIPLLPALEISFINMLEGYLAFTLFHKFKLSTTLERFRDIVGLALLIIVIQIFSATVSNFTLWSNGLVESSAVAYSTFAWWFGNVMGQFLFTPFLLIFFTNYPKIDKKEYLRYAFLFTLFLLSLETFITIHNPFLLISLTLSLSIYMVAKKGIVYGTLFIMVVATIESLTLYFKKGSFYYLSSTIDNTLNYNLFILAHVVIVLVLGILLEERRRYIENLQELIEEEIAKNKEQQLMMIQQSRLAQMGEMISMIAHQWRQPLNNLSLVHLLLLSKFNKGKLDQEAMEYFQKNAKKQIQLMSSTIDDFRNFFKSNKVAKEFFLNDMVQDTLDITKTIYDNEEIEIDFKSDGNHKILGFPNELAQVLLNILNNAKDALNENEVEKKKIAITIRKEEDEGIVLTIADNAGGIPEEIMEKIFDPYFSTKTEKNGTGLGLYMSKMIITEQLQGQLSVKNLKEGAMFTIYFPPKQK